MMQRDQHWMAHALGLARRGVGHTATNPSVGCVIVKNDTVLGRGRTGESGRPHAERIALDDAKARWGADHVRGATAYVTLEPCAHTGKTPPCTDALITSGIARVVAPLPDPDNRVSGKGFAMLKAAGIQVDIGEGAIQTRAILRGYLSRIERTKPFLTLKLASTLDGNIATSNGESRWITGSAARNNVHLMRSCSDAILVGVGSVLADDPSLEVRLPGMEGKRPKRVVADTRLQTPLTGRLARTIEEQPLILLTSHDTENARVSAFEALGAEVIRVGMEQSSVSMKEALAKLAVMGVGSLLCEGGGRLAASLVRENLVDELVWFSAGATMGHGGAPAISNFGIELLSDMPRFTLISSEPIGADIKSVWRPI